jgi:hypothetical protein
VKRDCGGRKLKIHPCQPPRRHHQPAGYSILTTTTTTTKLIHICKYSLRHPSGIHATTQTGGVTLLSSTDLIGLHYTSNFMDYGPQPHIPKPIPTSRTGTNRLQNRTNLLHTLFPLSLILDSTEELLAHQPQPSLNTPRIGFRRSIFPLNFLNLEASHGLFHHLRHPYFIREEPRVCLPCFLESYPSSDHTEDRCSHLMIPG